MDLFDPEDLATNQELGVVGMGRMGGNVALQAIDKGMRVVGFARRGVPQDLMAAGVVSAPSLEALVQELRAPAKVFLYVPSGAPVDAVIDGLLPILERGDIVADCGNS
jgi:6-phosphogluconate dehydrogenase